MTSALKITPCLWFNSNAEEAVEHYLSIFENSRAIFEMKKLDIAKLRQAFGPNQEESHGSGIHQ